MRTAPTRWRQEGIEDLHDLVVARHQLLGLGAERLGQPRRLGLEQPKDFARHVAHRLVHRALVERRIRFGGEIRGVGIPHEGEMQLGGASPEQPRRVEVGANHVGYRRPGRLLGQEIDERFRGGDRPPFSLGDDPLEEPLELLVRVGRGVRLVRDEPLHERERHRLFASRRGTRALPRARAPR